MFSGGISSSVPQSTGGYVAPITEQKPVVQEIPKEEAKVENKLPFEDIENVIIRADRDLLQQVIYNLLDNAVKFTPENGTIYIYANNDGEKTTVRIRNSGAGVSPQEISRIFERFYKVDKSRSYDVKGGSKIKVKMAVGGGFAMKIEKR